MYDEIANGLGATDPSGKFLAFPVAVFPAVVHLLLSNQTFTVVFYRVLLVNLCWGRLRLDLTLDHSYIIKFKLVINSATLLLQCQNVMCGSSV